MRVMTYTLSNIEKNCESFVNKEAYYLQTSVIYQQHTVTERYLADLYVQGGPVIVLTQIIPLFQILHKNVYNNNYYTGKL